MAQRLWGVGLAGMLLGLLLYAAPVRAGVVCGESMSPTMQDGTVYLLNVRNKTGIGRGDVVVFRQDGMNYIKRVAAVGGDTIYLLKYRDNEDYDLVMDWQLPLIERVVEASRRHNTGIRLVKRTLLPGTLFVLGDNFTNSVDSRHFGPIQTDQIIGTVVDAPPQPGLDHVAGVFARRSRS